MEQQRSQIPSQYYEIGRVMDSYKQVICNKFRNNEASLVEELEQKVRELKKSIAQNKQKTSQENIEQLISKKRHEKQAQRLELQIHWRNLTQKYKKLQQQEKKINQENRENKFDILNLQNKIQTLQKQNIQLDKRIDRLKQSIKNQSFLTEINNATSYTSPYKYTKPLQSSQSKKSSIKKFDYNLKNNASLGKLIKTSNNFRLKLQQKDKKIIDRNVNKFNFSQKENNYENQISNLAYNSDVNVFNFDLTQKKEKFMEQNHNLVKQQYLKMKNMDINPLYIKKDNQMKRNQLHKNRFSVIKDKKWQELMNYLDKPEVRQKVFDLLRK